MNGTRRFVVLLAVCAVSAKPSLGQSAAAPDRGAALQKLVVVVKDENGVAVAAARVQVKAQQLTNSLRCATDFAGHCELSILTGTYEVNVEKTGFYVASVPDAKVEGTISIDVTLQHQRAVREVVKVVESPPGPRPIRPSLCSMALT